MAFFSQLLSLYFFAIIGRFDTSESDDILRNYMTLSGLASTICMCILVVYGTVMVNRFLVKNYIGESKIRFYLYPFGRSQLFYTKVASFCGTFVLFQLLGITLSNAIFLLTESLFPILITSHHAFMHLTQFLVTSISAVILTISIIIISSISGIFLNSTVATIVTGIVLVVVFGNILAMSFASNLLVTLVSSIVIASISGLFVKMTGTKIEKDEVLTK